MTECGHNWGYPISAHDRERRCSLCHEVQVKRVKPSKVSGGHDAYLSYWVHDRVEEPLDAWKPVSGSRMPEVRTESAYEQYNVGLGETPSSKSDYYRIAKEKGLRPLE